jgi:RNA polymerase sigma-70 factor (ECF subfamily)
MSMSSPFATRDYSTDTGLAQRASQGDAAAQRELFRSLKSTVHATLYRVLGSNEHMEDLLQDAFVEIFRSLPSYRGESKLTTWAGPIAARTAFHYLRNKRARNGKEHDNARPVPLRIVGSAEDDAEHREGLKRVYTLLRRMKPEQHVALALFMVDGRSIEEVATLTGVSRVAAKNRISRARRKLWAAARKDQVLAGYLAEVGVE